MDQITAAPETHDSRPPVVVESAPNSGAAANHLRRTTAKQRAIIRPLPWVTTDRKLITYGTDHPYVRLYWTATIGPGAVADMMRYAYYCRAAPRQELVPTSPNQNGQAPRGGYVIADDRGGSFCG